MPKVQVQAEIEDSGYNIVKAVAKAVKDVRAAKALGGGVPAEVGAALVDAISLVTEFPKVGADFAESKEEFLKGVVLAGFELFEALK